VPSRRAVQAVFQGLLCKAGWVRRVSKKDDIRQVVCTMTPF
jgi:hypothetical protein